MDLAVQKFAYEIVNDVFTWHQLRPIPVTLLPTRYLASVPVLYNQRCKQMANYCFLYYKNSIPKYYLKGCKSFNENTFNLVANKLIYVSKLHHQCAEVFCRLCVQLALLGVIYFEKGFPDGVTYAIKEIVQLANKAYLRCVLDEKHDHMHNFSFDILNAVFNWAGREIKFDRELKRLNFDCGSTNYFAVFKSYFLVFLKNKGKSVLDEYNAIGSNLRALTKEAYVFRIQDLCDEYYKQLGHLDIVNNRTNFLDTCMYISLLTLHAFEILYPCDLMLAHGTILRLAILTTRYGILTFENQSKSENHEAINII